MTDGYDVLVAGGGPAGAATALALRRRGVPRVILVEGSSFDGPRIGESIPPDTRRPLAALGLWESFAGEGHEPCHGSCSSWGSDELGYNDFLFNPYGHGFHLDRSRFDPWLARAAAAAGAEVRLGTKIASVARMEDAPGFAVHLAGSADPVRARFVVDATGRGAWLSRQLGARRVVQDRLTFLYGFFPKSVGPSSLTLLEAVPDGWWYAARLPSGRLVVAVASDPEIRRGAEGRGLDGWMAGLRATTHVRALVPDGAAPEGELVACEAPSARLDRAAGPEWAAVGDAASSFDPLSAQGIHKALSSALAAAEAIAGELDGSTPGAVERYARSIAEGFRAYARTRAHFYEQEGRWAEAPFWARRRLAGRWVDPLAGRA